MDLGLRNSLRLPGRLAALHGRGRLTINLTSRRLPRRPPVAPARLPPRCCQLGNRLTASPARQRAMSVDVYKTKAGAWAGNSWTTAPRFPGAVSDPNQGLEIAPFPSWQTLCKDNWNIFRGRG